MKNPPTRKDEAFRYTDLEALSLLWPVTDEVIRIDPCKNDALTYIETGEKPCARHLSITIEDGASLDLRVLNIGTMLSRFALDVTLGEKAQFTFGAAQLGSGKATLEIVTKVSHQARDAKSQQIVRSVLAGEATGTYLGQVAVARGADGTDSDQSIRSILLDRTATANAKPELEIFADDVKSTHGCAIGELDAMGLFYLESRGLPPPEAKHLMLQAFISEAFAGAPDEEKLQQLAFEKLKELV